MDAFGQPAPMQRAIPTSSAPAAKAAPSRSAAPEPQYFPLIDEDAGVSRTIARESSEFQRDYVDNNIDSVDYWSTPYASSGGKYRTFTVNYRGGRKQSFNLDEIPLRVRGAGVRIDIESRQYRKKGGIIYPDGYRYSTTPHLTDVAGTIVHNQKQRERGLELTQLTFTYATILSTYAMPPETPNLMKSVGKLEHAPLPPPEPPAAAPKYIAGSAEAERAILAGQEAEKVWRVVVSTEKNNASFPVLIKDQATGRMKIVDVIPDFMPTAEKNAAGEFRSARTPDEALLIADSKYKWTEGKNVAQDDQIRAMLTLAARVKKPFVFLVRVGSGVSRGVLKYAKQVGAEVHVLETPAVR